MKKLFLAALLVVGFTTFAQEQKEKLQRPEMEKLSPEQRSQLQLKKITKELNLNLDQQAQVQKLIAEQSAKREALRAKIKESKDSHEKPTAEDRAMMNEEKKEGKKAMDDKLKSILTPEQFEKWMSRREKNHEKKELKKE
jgi:septal ring factor EnvC (AmiA/AmiB activator)